MSELRCPFRSDVRTDGVSESATCEFIQRLTLLDAKCCTVDRSACEQCLQQSPFAPPQLNPVMPSLMSAACEAAGSQLQPGSAAAVLYSWASSVIEAQSMPCLVPSVIACDVILVCNAGDDISAAVKSIFAQDGVFVILHLVANGAGAFPLVEPFETRAGIRLHRFHEAQSTYQCVQALLPEMETPWGAIQTATSGSHPNRLMDAITTLQENRSELLGASIACGQQILPSEVPHEANYAQSLQPATLVFRRASLIDMGGFDLKRSDPVTELLYRAACEGRKIEVSSDVVVATIDHQPELPGEPPEYSRFCTADAFPIERLAAQLPVKPQRQRLRNYAACFPQQVMACDVVIPFRDDLEFVQESMNGLLQQRDVHVVIHLVDDASLNSTDKFFEQYRDYPNVRLYRNTRNLGPFATFNNVSNFAETPFIAVQDADDVSLPHRIATSVKVLQNSGAGMLGACTELFGDEELVAEIARECRITADGLRQYVRFSRYPDPRTTGYFLENPTLTMRLDVFRQLGGYADFGEGRRNRTGVDTELQARAHFAKAHIAVTNDVLVRYRCHGASATNHAASGFGSTAHVESHAELRRRVLHYATGAFDPKWFGALGQHFGITEKV